VAQRKLFLNAAVIQMPGDKIDVGHIPYDEAVLESLRKQQVGRLFAQRHNDVIETISLSPNEVIRGTKHSIELSDRPALVAALARESLIRFLGTDTNYPVLSARPLRVIGGKAENLVEAKYNLPAWLEKRLVMRFETRVLYRKDKAPRVVLTCDLGTRNGIETPCSELHRLGVPLVGRYVTVPTSSFDPRLEDYRRIVGRVVSVENGVLRLEDHEEGFESVRAESARLEPRRDNWNLCITTLLGEQAESVIENIDKDVSAVRQGDRRLALIRQTLNWLAKRHLDSQHRPELVPGMPLMLDPILCEAERNWTFPTKVLEKPHLVFSPSGIQTRAHAQRELDRIGPYDQRDFTPKALRIAVICQERHQGETSRCVGAFLDGLPDATLPGRNGYPPSAMFPNGLIGRFRMGQPTVETFTASSASAAAYAEACRNAIDAAADKNLSWDLAILQTEDGFRQLPHAENPYFVVKAAMLKRGVHVQAFSLKTMRLPKINLAYSLSNASLATYAKLGGIPWLLRSQPNTDHELVIGLGSHTERSSRRGPGNRTVGITTVFSSDGRYLLEDRTAAVPFDQYPAELKASLHRTISRVREEDAWRASDAVRLIFHVFKPLKSREIDVVEATVKELGLSNVRFAFIHVVDEHPFLLFDEANAGSPTRDGKKGVYAAARGTAVEISDNEMLLSMKGSQELKLIWQGTPRPLLLRLDQKSTFRDLAYLTTQLFDFACHSWRTFNAAALPVSILYSQLIAEILAGLTAVPGWDADAMRSTTGRTRWFL
jgi:hypothetical protein